MKTKLISIGLLAVILMFNTTSFSQAPAKLIVYRKGCIYGALASYKVKEDDKQLGVLKNGSYYAYELTPGSHTIAPRQAHRAITFDAQPGKTYVVKYKTRIGIFGARPKLKLMSVEDAKMDSKLFTEQYAMKKSM